jgi:hypothetical protein
VRAPLTLPPDVWEEFKEDVPARERSAVIAALLRKEIRRRQQEARREKVTLPKEEVEG